MKSSSTLDRILASNLCAGCGLCASLAPHSITIELTQDGFLRPRQVNDISAQIDEQIKEVCPGVRIEQDTKNVGSHILWGPIVGSRVGHSNRPELRQHASSGGAISALLTCLIDTRAIDYVVQTAASRVVPLQNATVESRDGLQIFNAAGSRYSPSSPLEKLNDYLNQPGKFALVGKPCDIAAARSLAKTDVRVNLKIPIMISFFCAGIPSQKGTLQILEKLGVNEHDVKKFDYRGDGWPGHARATTKNGMVAQMSYSDSWGKILSKHVQFRCKICPDGSGGLADVVCGDAWESDENGYPKFAEVDGQSLILTRTSAGEKLVQAAIQSHYLTVADLPIAQIEKMQPSQANRKRLVLSRLVAMAIAGKLVPRFKNMSLFAAARTGGYGANMKSMLGLLKRLARGKAKAF